MKRKSLGTILTVGLGVLAVVGVVLFWPQAPLDSALTSPAAPPARLICYGYVDSRQGPLLLQPARAGQVVRVFVQERQAVSKDAPLLQLDDRLVRLQEKEAGLAVQAAQLQLARARHGLEQYRARQAQAEAALEAARSKVLAAQSALAHLERLAEKDLTSPYEADVGRARLNEAQAQVKVEENRIVELKAVDPADEVKLAQVQLDRSQAQLDRARQEREEYLLQAPVAGQVLRVQAQEGDLLGPTSARPAVWLAPLGEWVVRAEVSQEFAGRVRQGLEVQVEDEASTEVLGRGRIAEASDWFLPRRLLNPLPSAVNTGLTMECVIEVRAGHAPLRLGQRVRARILADQPVGGSSSADR